MIFLRNDYGEGCIQPILDLMSTMNDTSKPGYGEDDYCRKAAELIQSKLPDTPSDIHFIAAGTLTNLTVLRHLLHPYDAIIAPDTGHIVNNEGGAIESIGHKILSVPNNNGKLTPAAIRKVIDKNGPDNHTFIRPKAIYISNTTELGTVYTREELEELSALCDELNLYMFMDGARMGTALMSGVDYSLNDIAKWADVFTIGGTKNGALFGEAVVITNPDIKPYFRYSQKNTGAILAKGWLLGMQFIGLFENDDFYKCAGHANELARQIQDCVIDLEYPIFTRTTANMVFVILNEDQLNYLKDKVDFEIFDKRDGDYIIRLVTSWHSTQDDVDELKKVLKEARGLPEAPKAKLPAVVEEQKSEA